MKIKIITILLCCFAAINLYSQDIIIKKDGKKLSVIIKKVTKNNIKYILYEDPNKVLYSIDKVLITNVIFAFGKKDLDVNDPEKNLLYFAEDKIHNIMVNFSAFSGNTFAVAYEKAIKPGQSFMTELKIYGFGSKSSNEIDRSGFGLDLHYRLKTKSFFSKKKYRPKHILDGPYIAPVIGFSTGKINHKYAFYEDKKQNLKHSLIHFGIQYGNQWIIQRIISIDASFGYHYYFGSRTNNDEYDTISLGNMIGNNNKLFSFNLRIGFLTGKHKSVKQ
jgi:hypothetical protein